MSTRHPTIRLHRPDTPAHYFYLFLAHDPLPSVMKVPYFWQQTGTRGWDGGSGCFFSTTSELVLSCVQLHLQGRKIWRNAR